MFDILLFFLSFAIAGLTFTLLARRMRSDCIP